MRRQEIREGARELLNALEEAQISLIFEPSKRDEAKAMGLASYRLISLKLQQMSNSARDLLPILNLGFLNSQKFWEQFLLGTEKQHFHEAYRSVYHATEFLPRIINLMDQHTTFDGAPSTIEADDERVLTAILVEQDGAADSPERVTKAIKAVQLLYDTCNEINGNSGQNLTMVSCDSGSDKSFDFMGAAEVVKCVKETVLSLWSGVIYHREKSASMRLENMAKSLPIVTRIHEMEEAGIFEKEQAGKLKSQALEAAGLWLESGVIIPELEGATTYNPRALLAPEPKLLVPPKTKSQHPAETNGKKASEATPSSALSAEDKDLFEEFKKFRAHMSTDNTNDEAD